MGACISKAPAIFNTVSNAAGGGGEIISLIKQVADGGDVKAIIKRQGLKMGSGLVSKYTGININPGIGFIMGDRDWRKGPAEKIHHEDNGVVEDMEDQTDRTCENERVQAAIDKINEVIASGEPFTDEEFPPCWASYVRDDEVDKMMHPNMDGDWARAPDLIDNPGLFKGGPSIDDIQQGGIGNCYLLSAICQLVEHPENLKNMFINKTMNASGIYGLIFYINGEATPVIVDDHFMFSDGGRPNFAQFKHGKFWVSIIEKAWAKIHGSYERTVGGQDADPFTTFTGYPSRCFHHGRADENEIDNYHVFDILVDYDQKGYALAGAAKPGDQATEEDKQTGMVYGHAYTMLRAFKFEHEGETLRLLKMRNPHGRGEWNGAWSDGSDLWTDELKDQLGWEERDDGAFFIDYEDYLHHFSNTQAHIFLTERVPVQRQKGVFHQSSPVAFNFTLDDDLDCSEEFFAFKAENCGPKHLEYRNRNEAWSKSRIQFQLLNSDDEIVKETKINYYLDESLSSFMSQMFMEVKTLPAGEYTLIVEAIHWDDTLVEKNEEFGKIIVDVLSQRDVNFRQEE